ncbi:hypothetical protein C808_05039 [Lachnospiraceae bacterium M18-1]|nr:hypothetical protein C808_05039 [Lachnospiraceae bacterium M18-1]
MEFPLISIIVPIFNVEKFIPECIESIQKQSYTNMQVILVDDGSTDSSGKICDKYASGDARIEVIHQQNKGLVAARKSGLKKAKGKYIGFVDGDDYIDSDMYQTLVREMEETKVDFVHCRYWEKNSTIRSSEKKVINLSVERISFLENTILGVKDGITPSIWSKLFKADLIKKTYDQVQDQYSLGEDFLNVCLCILECDKIMILDDPYYHYRIREGSLSHKNDIHDLYDLFKLYTGLTDILSVYGYYNDLEKTTDEFLWNNLLAYMDRINSYHFQIEHYYFNEVKKLEGKRIVIYGAAKVGRDYYAQISRYTDCEIALWVDRFPEKYHYSHITLHGVEALDSTEFDLLLIAVLREETANEIYDQLIDRGIDQAKIFWSEPELYSLSNKKSVRENGRP